MRRLLEKRNFYKQINTERIGSLINEYEALCEVAYDPKCVHKCWVEFIKETGYKLNIDILSVKEKVDGTIERLLDYIDDSLDKNKND